MDGSEALMESECGTLHENVVRCCGLYNFKKDEAEPRTRL